MKGARKFVPSPIKYLRSVVFSSIRMSHNLHTTVFSDEYHASTGFRKGVVGRSLFLVIEEPKQVHLWSKTLHQELARTYSSIWNQIWSGLGGRRNHDDGGKHVEYWMSCLNGVNEYLLGLKSTH